MKTMHRTTILAVALSLAGPSLPAAVAPPGQAAEAGSAGEASAELMALREQGIALHDRAVEGDEGAAEEAASRLQRYLDRVAPDGEAQAYLGSAYAMMARDASSVVSKTRYVNRSVRHLDRALETSPRMFSVRLIRAKVNSSLPKMFGRGGAALEDMLALDEIYRDAPSPAMARQMVGVYEDLQSRAPDAGPWTARLGEARERSGSRPVR